MLFSNFMRKKRNNHNKNNNKPNIIHSYSFKTKKPERVTSLTFFIDLKNRIYF
jgi:hypothetical protein